MAKYQLTKRKLHRAPRGFTLVEMLISVGIFTVIMTISVGALLTVFDAYQKTRLLRNTMENVNIATESMIKKIRTATLIDCDPGTVGQQDCPTSGNGRNSIEFLGADGLTIYTYAWDSGNEAITVDKSSDTLGPRVITSPEIKITSLVFYVDGVADNTKQDIVTVTVSGFANISGKSRFDTTFNLQTTVSKRILDLFGP
ncbi:hypothetical protein CL634_03675 [bacterium]|nr:hypothetical protein [bacterium]